MMRQHIAILCDNKPGVLTHVSGLISRRAINIECINAGYTEEADVTRINIVVPSKTAGNSTRLSTSWPSSSTSSKSSISTTRLSSATNWP